jgi:phage terminase small subunit
MATLNEKQTKFCEEYVANGYNGTAAYRTVYSQEDDNSAAVAAHKLLRNSKIVDKIKEIEGDYRIIGHKLGIDKKLILTRLRDLLSAKKQVFFNGEEVGLIDDNSSVNKAIENIMKIMGDFAPEKKELSIEETDVDLSKMSEEERKEYKEKLLRSLT